MAPKENSLKKNLQKRISPIKFHICYILIKRSLQKNYERNPSCGKKLDMRILQRLALKCKLPSSSNLMKKKYLILPI